MTFFFSEAAAAPLADSACNAKLLLHNCRAAFDLGMEKQVATTGSSNATTKLTTLMMMI
jgi:hypothetical protein